MAQEITEELRVLVTAEVDKAVRNMKKVDTQTSQTEKLFKNLGKTIGSAFAAKEIIRFAAESVKAYESQAATLRVLEATVKSTGAAAWTSAEELANMASEFQKVSNYGDDAIESMQSVLLGFRNIKGDNFREATQAILDMATVMNMDLASAAQSVGKALDDPIHGMDSLRKQGFQFSDAQKKVIKSLLDTGDTAGAQKIILDELSSTFGGAAEAGVKASEQIKMSWGDLKESFGEFITELPGVFGLDSAIETAKNWLTKVMDKISHALSTFGENIEYLKSAFGGDEKFAEWFGAQTLADQLKEANKELENWRQKLKEAKNSDDINEAVREIERWRQIRDITQETLENQKAAAQAEAEQAEALSKINDLMYSIETEYEKMSKTDPSIQLQKYNDELKKIAGERAKLLSANTLGIDRAEIDRAVSQLDYMEKAINKKMLAISVNGKKTWQNWLSGIFSQDLDTFTNGKDAAERFIRGIEAEIDGERQIANALGMAFDLSGALESQREKVRSALVEMFSIDPELINESFKTGDASVDTLLEWYRNAGKQSAEAFQSSFDESFNKALALSDAMGKTADETEIAKEKMSELERRINDVAGAMSEAALTDALKDQNSEISILIENYNKLAQIANQTGADMEETLAEASKALKDLNEDMKNLSFSSALTGLKSVGEELGKGKSAEDAWRQGLQDMSLAILDALPNLFLRAGLQLIADGMWPVGLGLIAASGVTAITSGAVHGSMDSAKSAKANALGGVYGAPDYDAFAKGGAFTNEIVTKPTFFRFASGGGFRTGLMGEAGPEAVMPLTRGSDGSLGVSAFGGHEAPQVIINITADEQPSVSQTTDANGNQIVDIILGAVGKGITNGRLDGAMRARYGLKVIGR